ncbi:hypothetical protein F4777DRAFT_278579 [Nemania sp. FL0916]|nr:hypothetical protein F4777DRAFT_278579 [Nemania sp. FL0916]
MSLFPDQAGYQPRRPAHKTEELSQPWTTARCHRLLRPLVSRIASLRKETATNGQTKKPTTTGSITASSVGNGGRHEEPDPESGWLMPKKKRPRLTYSQRRGAQSGQTGSNDNTSPPPGTNLGVTKALKCIQLEQRQKCAAPGEIVASTPMLRRARGKIVQPPMAPTQEVDESPDIAESDKGRRVKNASGAQRRLEERLSSLRETLVPEYSDLEGIYRSFEALLRATAASTVAGASAAKGPRSLLDMCLRKVPQYIVELDAWERFDAEESGSISTLDDINTSALVYNELESLGTNVGWRHLRVVVRADGLIAVRQGIEEGLFGDGFSHLIIDLCVQLGATSEAEELIAALVGRQYLQPLSTESRFTEALATKPLLMLNSFATQMQRASFLFRQYAMLLTSGNLPTDWLATTEFEWIWSLAIQGLTSPQPGHDAINFITQSLSLLSRRKRSLSTNADGVQLEKDMAKASQRRLMSVLGILTSMCLLGELELNAPWLPESDTRQITVIGDKVRYIIRACIHELGDNTLGRGNQRLEFLYLALFLSSGQSQGERVENRVAQSIGKLLPSLNSLSNRDLRMRNHYDSIAWLIASIARACGRGTSTASHQCLDGLFTRLVTLEIDRTLLDKLKAAAAFSVAQQTNNVRDLIYAESLHPPNRSGPGPTSHQQSDNNTLFTGYRWEETIGEWVTVSPVMKKGRASLRRSLRSSIPTNNTERTTSSSRLSDDKTSLNQGAKDDESSSSSTDEYIRSPNDGQGKIARKRPRHLQSAETLTTTLATKVPPAPLHSLRNPAPSKMQQNQADPEKENRVRLLAKRPRRSSGKIVLGTRAHHDSTGGQVQHSRDSISSDDELCI